MTNFRLAAAVAPLAVLVASLAPIGGFASAQVTGEADPGEAEQPQLTPPTDEARQRFEQLPPEVQLGARAGGLQASWPVERTLVIAESPAAYANAIASWTLERRFPVLIDDGTPRAAWDIARFAHAFEPNRVLLFDEPGRFEAMVFGDSQPTGRRVLEEVAVASANAWGKENAGMRAIAWKRQGFTSPGLVYASEFDPAWTAALALGAGRGQPIFWLNRKAESLNAILNADAASAFEQTVRAGLVRNNAPWNQIGDDIDAVTLCLNIATRVRSEDGEVRALSDVLARNDDGSRYAWASIVPGSEAQAAYMAMSSLFLRPEKAWLFDGYADDFAPEYDVRPAEPLLEEAGLDVTMTRGDAATIDIWRALAKRGIDADFVHVNSSGMASLFNLRDSTVGYASDVPLLSRPAAVHFIHSFAAQRPGSRDTIAARWLDHGAFAFYGSAAEPFLGAFYPAKLIAARMRAPAPWAAAVRQNAGRFGEPWKLNAFGDALYVWTPEPPQLEPLPDRTRDEGPDLPTLGTPLLDDLRPVDRLIREAAGARDHDRLLRLLSFAGRRDDAVNLAKALVQAAQKPSSSDADAEGGGASAGDGAGGVPNISATVSESFAELALPLAFFESDVRLFTTLYQRLGADAASSETNTTMLWQLLRPTLGRTDDYVRTRISLLRAHPRSASLHADAAELAPHVRREFGQAAEFDMFNDYLMRTNNERIQQRLRDAMRR